MDLLTDVLLVRRLQPWGGNINKRLVRTPTVYLRDTGLLHVLLSLGGIDDVLSHPIAGASWEGFVIEQLVAAAGPHRTPLYFRTEKGAEADLVLERGGEVEMIIEIKRSRATVASRGLHVARADLGPRETHVVHGGIGSWPMGDGIAATALADLVQSLRQR